MSVQNPQSITVAIPTAREIDFKGHRIVAVKHTLDSARVLRNLGLDAPSPIMYDGFEFGGRFAPMSHQIQTAEFLTLHTRAFCFNTMGTGKTAAALWTMEYLKQRGYVGRVLIISPLSVMDVWANEIFGVIPHRNAVQLVGKREKRLELIASGTDIAIINFDGVATVKDALSKWKPDLVIVDEADAYCNAQTKRYKALQDVLKIDTRLWLLTGTPAPNAPTDAYGLIRLVNPKAIPASFKLFRETLMFKKGPYKWFPKPGATERIFELMQPAIRFTKKECLDLPPITFNSRAVQMSDKQLEVFDAVKASMRHEDEDSGSEIRAANAAVKLIKLQQILCGAVKDTDGNPMFLDPTGRLELVKNLCDQSEGKVIIFVPFIHAMHMVQNYMSPHYETFLVNGEVNKNARSEIFARFQTEAGKQILVAHPKVAAHGLTLTAANTIIWYAPTFSIGQYLQANARIDRTGQTLPMSVYNIYSHPVELAIYSVLQARENMQTRMLDLYSTALA